MNNSNNTTPESMSYLDSEVSIQRGDEFVDFIKTELKKSGDTESSESIGLFGSVLDLEKFKDYEHPLIVTSTDGVGTKLKIANRLNKHNTIGIDLVAMCVNDVLCHGARPLQFLDYIATSKITDEVSRQVMLGIIEGCSDAGCKLTGGETAEMPQMYKNNEYDLAGFCLAIAERKNFFPKTNIMESGDVLVGLRSSGFHANGFSLINMIIDKYGIEGLEGGLETLLKPTKIYVKEALRLVYEFSKKVRGMAHITGGGIEGNLKRIIPSELKMDIDYDKINKEMHPEFHWVQKAGNITDEEMKKVFNLGIGFVFVISSRDSKDFLDRISDGFIIGNLTSGIAEKTKR